MFPEGKHVFVSGFQYWGSVNWTKDIWMYKSLPYIYNHWEALVIIRQQPQHPVLIWSVQFSEAEQCKYTTHCLPITLEQYECNITYFSTEGAIVYNKDQWRRVCYLYFISKRQSNVVDSFIFINSQDIKLHAILFSTMINMHLSY